MSAMEIIAHDAGAWDDGQSAYRVVAPPDGVPSVAVVFASPHSGRVYPPSLMAASHLGASDIRRSEDAFVDDLVAGAPGHGIPLIAARFARAWLDLNREPWELDQGMFEDELPAFARGRTARVAAGLGAIARVVCEGLEIYRRKLTFAEAASRVEGVHRPYHEALGTLLAQTRQAHGLALLIDWHSMPSAAAGQAIGGCDIVLGDRFGAAASPAVARRVERELKALGYSVMRNTPYAGGYTTETYGRPARQMHALQIEVNRALYLDEATLEPTDGYGPLKADLERLTAALARIDWSNP
ncbi:MAG TPA: N-formylglutamate amidohydrolase [Caulobacteraceae bacterium]|jgi:N-formylglutamate amidohydrolase|nr:N-formylglutamate amidohydrolase [Caulobacteraceae bacterium]